MFERNHFISQRNLTYLFSDFGYFVLRPTVLCFSWTNLMQSRENIFSYCSGLNLFPVYPCSHPENQAFFPRPSEQSRLSPFMFSLSPSLPASLLHGCNFTCPVSPFCLLSTCCFHSLKIKEFLDYPFLRVRKNFSEKYLGNIFDAFSQSSGLI